MTRLLDREWMVLEEVVRSYICQAVPVSSHHIASIDSISSSPATVRNIMMDLEDRGFLTQPHTSAGRIPTQKAYRFFVDNCIVTGRTHAQTHGEEEHAWNKRMQLITKKAHVFTAVLDEEEVSHFGTAELFSEPEFAHDADLLRSFGSFMDSLPAILEEYHAITRHEVTPRVFIERENPVSAAQRMSIVASLLDEERGVMIALGPSRMNYEMVITLLQ